METTDAFDGLRCLDCAGTVDATTRCPECGGILEATYDEDALRETLNLSADAGGPEGAAGGLARFAGGLPLPADRLVALGEGETPLVPCPTLSEEFDVERVLVKDEARNPTGSVVDRGLAVAVSVASEEGASEVVLPTTGNGGQAAAAYASRAGLESESFVPSRTLFANKAMINVHDGDMNVVGGRYGDAVEAFEDAEGDRYSLAPFETPYRQEGIKTLAYELVADLGGAPDAVVCPTGHGITLRGLYAGFRDLVAIDAIDDYPRLYAAQAGGCAPIATAWEQGETTHEPVEYPDTICGTLEVPDPTGGPAVIDALEATDGAAIATGDEPILERALTLAQDGVPTSATGGAAISGAAALAEQGAFDADETVVLVNPTTANREADLLRSHLMSKGV